MASKIVVIPLAAAVSATPLHDGTNGPAYPNLVQGFILQPNGGDIYVGEGTVTGGSDGLKIVDGTSINVYGFHSRGTHDSYDLSRIFYIGGPVKLILERPAT